MDKIKERLAALRAEADAASARAEKAEGLIKRYEQIMLEKDQEIASLQRRLSELEQKEDTTTKEARAAKEQLNETSIRTEHLEREALKLVQDRDDWERKYEEMVTKHKSLQAELDDFLRGVI